jgi:hypothetical protein
MATVEYIAEKDAPAPPKTLSKSAQDTLRMLHGLKDGQVAKVTPDEGQTLRGLKTSFSRVAKGQGIKIQVWGISGDNHVYVKRTK